jgi:hypothetical protein
MKKILPYLMLLMLVAVPARAATTYRYSDSVTTVRGDAVGGASVTVYNANTTTKATLYSSSATGTKANPATTDGYGRFSFYLLPGTYDFVVSGTNVTSYTIEDVRVFSDTGYTYNVMDYGVTGAGAANDSTGINAAIDAAEASVYGGRVYFPPGIYLASGIKVRGNDICIDIDKGATIVSASTNRAAFLVDDSEGFSMTGGGTISGPVTLTSSCNAVLVDSCYGARFDDINIVGFRNGIRATSATTHTAYSGLSFVSTAFCALWPHSGDIVTGCRFEDIGTLSTHHGIYMDEETSDVVLSGNYYKNITGAGVQIYSPSAGFSDISCTGEVFDRCGVGYIIAGTPAVRINISGAVIDSCRNLAANETQTGVGINITGTAKNLNISATISYPDSLLLNTNTSLSDSKFNIAGVGAVVDGIRMYGSDCIGTFSVDDCGAIGFYLGSSSSRNNFTIKTRGNASNGIYVSGADRNMLSVITSLNNIGIGLTSGADSNVVSGMSGANTGNELDNAGTGNTTSGLVTW